ncbi:MAG TPA: hypothetical protein VFI06_07975 [Chitinophagaceae bacterium]|nr:hypothetical protein [Chitinophagaceae bacterium]
MRKYFLSILAIGLAIGFSAFTIPHDKTNKEKQTYVWHKYNAAGTAELSPIVTYTGTEAGAKSAFGCSEGTTVFCARAYDSEGSGLDLYVKKSPQ